MAEVAGTEKYGPFEILERLGSGRVATVDRAIERGGAVAERVVALKRLLPQLAEDESFMRPFMLQARLASRVRHANIVQIYDLGRIGLSYFVSMEYVAGRDLRAILRHARRVSGPPPIGVTLSLLTGLLSALDHAHNQSGADGRTFALLHAGISPSKLIVSHTGQLKVADFGMARAVLDYMKEWRVGLGGKLPYIAPELLAAPTASVALEGRPDLFSASVIAHELLTAAPLFAAKDDAQTIQRLRNMPRPPPSARNPACPPELDEVVLRGLAVDPKRRWRSAAEMRAALAEVANGAHRRAANREVSEWIHWAFQMPPPARLRLPLAAPPDGPSPGTARPSLARADQDDEIIDNVWGATVLPAWGTTVLPARSTTVLPAPAEFLLDEVSELGGRLSPLAEEADEAEETPTSLSTLTSMATLTPAPAWPAAPARIASSVVRESSRRTSFLPFLFAFVVVCAVGTSIGWLLSTGGYPPRPGSAAAPPAVQRPGVAAGSDGSAPGQAPKSIVASLVTEPRQASGAEESEDAHDARAARDAAGEAGGDARKLRGGRTRRANAIDPGGGAAQPQPRPGAAGAAADGEEAIETLDGGDRPLGEDGGQADGQTIAGAVRSPEVPEKPAGRSAKGSARESARASSSDPARIRPPAAQPPATPSAPITIPSSRTRLASGNDRLFHFPPGEQLPPTIVARLCTDPSGSVTSVTVQTAVSPAVRRAVERLLYQWRYEPIVEGNKRISACFASELTVRVE